MVAAREVEMRVGMALIADPLVLLAVGGPNPALHWSLLPGGPSVTSRADGLKLIRGLAAGGALTFEMGKRAYPPLEIDGGPWEYEDEWRLFEDLAVLEEWSGATLPMPDEVTAEEATRAAQAASWARTEQVEAVLAGAISFTTREVLREVPDELRLFQRFGARVLGMEVPLGKGAAVVKLRRVDREGNDGLKYRALPDQTDVRFLLSVPAERRLPPRRTQGVRVPPPREQGEEDRLGSLALTRRAGRPFAEVLASRRLHSRAGSVLPSSTAALLDDIRGE
jgi:hypothetical protein